MNLNLVTVLNGSGYGTVGLCLLRALTAAGHQVALFPREQEGFPLELRLDDVVLVRQGLKQQGLFDLKAPCLRISSEFDMGLFAGRGPRCGLTFFETDAFTAREKHHLQSLDLLLVPSQWAMGVVRQHLRGPRVAVIPLGVDRTIFSPRPASARTTEDTVFLHVGKWEHRKGQDFLIKAYEKAFGPDDPVRLRLMSHNPLLGERNAEWMREVAASPMARRIECLPRVASLEELANVIHNCDCGVFPARCEGWNLELLELMACGKPVIATDYAGHSEFAHSANCRLITIDDLEEARDDRWMTLYSKTKTGRWPRLGESQLEQLVEHLRAVHRLRQSGDLPFNQKGAETAEAFSWDRSAGAVVDALSHP